MEKKTTVIFLLVCPDTNGIVSNLSSFIYNNGGCIVDSDFHNDHQHGYFLGRIEWLLEGFQIKREEIKDRVCELCSPYNGKWSLLFSDTPIRVAIWCSKQDHCVLDLLWRHQAKELGNAQIAVILSNHPDLEQKVANFNVPFVTLPINKENKSEVEQKQIELMREYNIDVIVLAKYMQILSDNLVDTLAKDNRTVINIHHSFLPAFIGAKPYHQAHKRGVKIIGATAHFVTAQLDAGPIIEQDVVRISHRDTVSDLIRKGKDLEKIVLARALRLHLLHKVLTYENKTVVFE